MPKILDLVRAYSVPIGDDRVSKLIAWYVKALQRAIDLIWSNIGWKYRFPKIVGKGGRLIVIRRFEDPCSRDAKG